MITKPSERRNLWKRVAGVTMPITRKRVKYGRNWLCLCGSGKKYKNCCINEINDLTASDDNANVETLSEDVQKMIDVQRESQGNERIKENG